jgi:hypothetical protein
MGSGKWYLENTIPPLQNKKKMLIKIIFGGLDFPLEHFFGLWSLWKAVSGGGFGRYREWYLELE